jgi:TRAP-type C4-dicarboxylate transport system substrate-binding protein
MRSIHRIRSRLVLHRGNEGELNQRARPWLVIGMLLTVLHASSGFAQDKWTLATVYPRDTMAGRGIEQFARALANQTSGAVGVTAEFSARKSAAQLIDDVRNNRLQVADVFSGSLAQLDPIFELPTLPFTVRSIEQAYARFNAADSDYSLAFSKAGLHLLLVSPWPPTGLWSRYPITGLADVRGLRIRTYDQSSAEVFQNMGARSVSSPASRIGALLTEGSLDAVLSSGDGDVGRLLETRLPNFFSISYAYPLSFVVMSAAVYQSLSAKRQLDLDHAAAQAQKEQWAALPGRIKQNYERMRSAGVYINTAVPEALSDHFNEIGRRRMDDWLWRITHAKGSAGIR